MIEEENNVCELIGDDGSVLRFKHLLTIEHNNCRYAFFTPLDIETHDEEDMVVVMRFDRDAKGEECLVPEENQEILDAVFEKFLDYMDEQEDEGAEEDEEDETDE